MKEQVKKFIGTIGYKVLTKKRFEVLERGPYIPDLDFHYLLKNVINKSEQICCLDIGANVGQTTKKFKAYFPNATIHAFEPIKKTYDLLSINTANLEGVTAYCEAMGNSIGEHRVYHRKDTLWNSLVNDLNIVAQKEGATSEIITVNSVDHFLADKKIKKVDILKSDTEGYDLNVLEGAKDSLSKNMIEIIYVEVGFDSHDLQHTYLVDVMEFLNTYNYSFCGLFELAYGGNFKLYYANALFISKKRLEMNQHLHCNQILNA